MTTKSIQVNDSVSFVQIGRPGSGKVVSLGDGKWALVDVGGRTIKVRTSTLKHA